MAFHLFFKRVTDLKKQLARRKTKWKMFLWRIIAEQRILSLRFGAQTHEKLYIPDRPKAISVLRSAFPSRFFCFKRLVGFISVWKITGLEKGQGELEKVQGAEKGVHCHSAFAVAYSVVKSFLWRILRRRKFTLCG